MVVCLDAPCASFAGSTNFPSLYARGFHFHGEPRKAASAEKLLSRGPATSPARMIQVRARLERRGSPHEAIRAATRWPGGSMKGVPGARQEGRSGHSFCIGSKLKMSTRPSVRPPGPFRVAGGGGLSPLAFLKQKGVQKTSFAVAHFRAIRCVFSLKPWFVSFAPLFFPCMASIAFLELIGRSGRWIRK